MEKLKVFEGFAGIGAVSKALERLGIPNELVGFSEIDKYAIKSFGLIHNVSEELNNGDVCLIDETKLPDFDLYTFGSPCQDFSVAGKQKGATWTCEDCGYEYNPLDVHYSKRDVCPDCNKQNINKTRSSLVVEALRIIRYKKPKYLLMENVKNLVGKQFKPSFDNIIAELQEYGYNTYWKVLNAKDYGIPQNRERVFVISIRKDIDNGNFKFPTGFDNSIRLRDLLEYEVDDKYYISQDKTEKLLEQLKNKEISNGSMLDLSQAKREGMPRVYNDISCTLTSRDYKEPRCILEDVCINTKMQDLQTREDGLACTLTSSMYKEPPQIVEVRPCLTPDRIEKRQNGRRFKENDEPSFTINTQDKHGILMVGMLDIKGNEQIRRVYDPDGLSPTLNTMEGGNRQPKVLESNTYKIGNANPSGNGMNGNVYDSEGLCPTLTTNKGEGIKVCVLDAPNSLQFIGGIDTTDKWIENNKEFSRNYKEGYRVYDSEGIACCQKTNGGGLGSNTGLYLENNLPKVIGMVSPAPELVGGIGEINFGKQFRQGNRVYSSDKTAMCLLSQPVGNAGGNSYLYIEPNNYRIRKLTPMECMRLMGFDDEDYYILKENGISNSQIYKMAGNSIVVNVLEEIFKNLFLNT